MNSITKLIIPIVFVACASPEKKIEPLNTQLQEKQGINGSESVGTNSAGDLVYQKKMNLVNELVKIEDEVTDLQDRVYGSPDYNSKGLYGKALACRKAKALKTGEMSFIPDKSPVVEEDQVRVGQDAQSQKLIALTEENLVKRLERFKEYKKVLFERREQVENYIEKCEVDLKK